MGRTGNHQESGKQEFVGYPPPTSSTIYCPNQFFDVVLPHYSRGVVRLVGFLIRQSLGWSDQNGNPVNEQIQTSYSDLIEKVGISRGAIRKSLDEALAGHLIVESTKARPNQLGRGAEHATFELCWDSEDRYLTEPEMFQGFFSGNGNLTYIPNAFFDYTIRYEKLSVVKVVGAILRFTIGFQTRKGFRRKQVKMSVSDIMSFAKTNSRDTIDRGVKEALNNGHLVRLQDGYFDRNGGINSQAAEYTIHWNDVIDYHPEAFKSPEKGIVESQEPPNGTKIGTEETVQKSVRKKPERFKNRYGENGSEIGTETVQKSERERFKNRNGYKRNNNLNNNFKQQQQPKPAVADEDESSNFSVSILLQHGFDRKTAERFSVTYPAELIAEQARWLSDRSPSKNPAGLLRRAIEENWPKPETPEQISSPEQTFVATWIATLAGNTETPVAPATTSDVRSSSAFLEAWSKIDPEIEPDEMGRQFAKWINRKENSNSVARSSVRFALSRFGDAFIVQLRKKVTVKQRGEEERMSESRKKRYMPDYQAWVAAQTAWLMEHHSEAFDAFMEDANKSRAILEQSEFISSEKQREIFLKQFDSEEAHISRMVSFFAEQHGGRESILSDFSSWDREINPNQQKRQV